MSADEILELYDGHARRLVGFFARRTGDPQLALDLLGDTFLVAFEQRRRCRARTDSERAAWLYRIAATKLAAHFRRGASERRATHRLASELRALAPNDVATIERLAGTPEHPELTAALEQLPEDQRQAIRLRVIDERPYAVVSQQLGVSEPAARARVSRGLRAIRGAIAGSTPGKEQ
jgi:RNA polymerase sigma-70 factor (ECF subfamily)